MIALVEAVNDGVTVPLSAIIGMVGALGGGIALLFKLLMSSKDKSIADLESRMKSLTEIADEGTRAAREMGNFMRAKDGKSPIIPVAAVVPEAHSPPTQRQREEAHIATLRADLAATKLAVGLSPRKEMESEKGSGPRTEPEQAKE
jgi:hypothetical protein